MDIRCAKCGEPWDMDTIHDEVDARFPELKDIHSATSDYQTKYHEVRKDFVTRGCVAFDARCNTDSVADPMLAELYALLGDDINEVTDGLEDIAYFS